MSFATSLVGLLVVSALSQATNYGVGYHYYNYNHHYKRPYYNPYGHHYNPKPGPACGSDPWKLPNCLGKSTLNLDTCQCECPVPSEFCSKGYHFSQVYCECLPNGPAPPLLPPPRPLPPAPPLPRPLPPVRPQCPPCRSEYAILDLSDCSCDCPASAQRYCVYQQILDPVACECYCPADARCRSHEVLDRATCRCHNPGPSPPTCSASTVRCNHLQIFDPASCSCVCVQVIVTVTETTPGERPGTPQVVQRTGTTRTPGGRPGTSRSRSSRRRRSAEVHLIEKRRKSKSRSPGTRTTTFTTIPGTPGRPGTTIETRRRVPAPCPGGQTADVNCECF